MRCPAGCWLVLQEDRPGKYLTGDELSHGDLAVFCNLSTLQSGWLDGEGAGSTQHSTQRIAHCIALLL